MATSTAPDHQERTHNYHIDIPAKSLRVVLDYSIKQQQKLNFRHLVLHAPVAVLEQLQLYG